MSYRDYHLYPEDKISRGSDFVFFYPLFALTEEGPQTMKNLCAMYHKAGPLAFFGSADDVLKDHNLEIFGGLAYLPAYLSEVWNKMAPIPHLNTVNRNRGFQTLLRDRPEQIAEALDYLKDKS